MRAVYFNFIGFLLISLVLVSCEEVIDWEVENASRKNVVEGVIMEGMGNNYVILSKSTGYTERPEYSLNSGQTVIIKDQNGVDHLCNEVDSGIYSSPSLVGKPGETYKLTVEIDDEDITSESTMPLPVPIDSVVMDLNTGFGSTFYTAQCYYTDPAEVANYYKYDVYLNGKKQYGTQVNNDVYSNGVSTYAQLFFTDSVIVTDSVMIVMHSIDRENYRYLSAIATGGFGGGNDAVPGNPESNLVGNAIGYFGAYSSSVGFTIVE